MGEAVRTCLRKYADFDGRASRGEFWWFHLAVVIADIVLVMIGVLAFLLLFVQFEVGVVLGIVVGALLAVLGAVMFVPLLAVGSRRLHDIGHSGWLQLILLIPSGWIVLAVLWAMEPQARPNRYGPPLPGTPIWPPPGPMGPGQGDPTGPPKQGGW